MSFTPRPVPTSEPGTWPGLTLVAATLFLEAEGEPDEGRVAIAWVIRNRADRRPPTLDVAHEVILGPDKVAEGDGRPFELFSCWNDDYRAQRVKRLTNPAAGVWELCGRAAAGAWWRLLPDPTGHATHYLNVELTRKIRPDGGLPAWFREDRITAKLGHHTFLRL